MLKFIFIFIIFFSQYIYALDATMEIIKRKSTLPTISVNVVENKIVKQKLLKDISNLIQKDILVSGHFNNSDLKFDTNFDSLPKYSLISQNGIDLYMLLDIRKNNLNGLIINVKLYDINSKILVFNKSYSTSSQSRYPFLCHKIAIDTNRYLNAPSIDWMDKFVIFARYLNSRNSEIVIADYTLTYQKVVVKGGLNIFPKWADKAQENFYYTTYNYGKPTLVKQNLFTRKKTKILNSDGMIVCSDVSEDGTKLVLTMAPNSQPDIYMYNIKTKLKKRITFYRGIDVGGSFVENDKKTFDKFQESIVQHFHKINIFQKLEKLKLVDKQRFSLYDVEDKTLLIFKKR
jgi:TolB protein